MPSVIHAILTAALFFFQDWERHRHSCTPFVPSIPPQLDPSSTTTKYAAILFPCDSDTPRIVDVHCMSRQGPTGPCKWTPLVYKYIGGEREPASALVTRGVGGAALRFPLQVHYRADFLVDGSPPNRSIQRLTGGHSTHQWNGNVIALKFFGNRRQGCVIFLP